ncbi:uncharacterized protein LOC130497080 [Raphanus sativus]|uniref:Uncharacterized protein LOC130497080 n=1 Tax=Raphanus sativus TaxID=3726 RepID=A0A9W3C3B2_RAPSA|nr:uncharacterized protein LOC130497080 [Raphanus sativus]
MGIRQKLHSGNEIRAWEDIWIPTVPARPAKSKAAAMHPMMPVSAFITGYWVAMNLLREGTPELPELSITKLQAFAWKLKTPPKIKHFIWQAISGQLATWAHMTTPTPPMLFPSYSHFTNMDYLFWRKNDIEDPTLDKDPYPWILWYIWKGRNDKLFRGVHSNPLETV